MSSTTAMWHVPYKRAAQACFAASLALHLAAPAQRLAPEALMFAVRVLRCAMPNEAAVAGSASARNPAPEPDPAAPPAPQWLLPAGGWSRADLGLRHRVLPLEVGAALGTAPGDAYFGSDAFRASALAAAMALPARAAQVFGKAAALPELLAPAARALRALGAAGLPQVGCVPKLRLHLGLGLDYRTLKTRFKLVVCQSSQLQQRKGPECCQVLSASWHRVLQRAEHTLSGRHSMRLRTSCIEPRKTMGCCPSCCTSPMNRTCVPCRPLRRSGAMRWRRWRQPPPPPLPRGARCSGAARPARRWPACRR